MDRLTEQQRTAISKRLRVKLVQVGYQEKAVGQLDRQSMMLTLAKYMADEEARTLAAAEVQERTEDENLDDSTDTQTQAGVMSLEERRLFLEERRFRWKNTVGELNCCQKRRWKSSV